MYSIRSPHVCGTEWSFRYTVTTCAFCSFAPKMQKNTWKKHKTCENEEEYHFSGVRRFFLFIVLSRGCMLYILTFEYIYISFFDVSLFFFSMNMLNYFTIVMNRLCIFSSFYIAMFLYSWFKLVSWIKEKFYLPMCILYTYVFREICVLSNCHGISENNFLHIIYIYIYT